MRKWDWATAGWIALGGIYATLQIAFLGRIWWETLIGVAVFAAVNAWWWRKR